MTLLEKIKKHLPGRGCKCCAYNSDECCCEVDWRSQKEVFADAVIARLNKGVSVKMWPEIIEAAKYFGDIY